MEFFQITSTASHTQFPSPDPFFMPVCGEFDGWLIQIHHEARSILAGRDADWLHSVAHFIEEAVDGRGTGTSDVLHLHQGPRGDPETSSFSFILNNPGRIGLFAVLEPVLDWDKCGVKTTRWERYAVFALVHIGYSINRLATNDQEGEPPIETPELLKRRISTLERAGSFALESMRSLQMARALLQAAQERTSKAKRAAGALHANREALLDQAMAIARSRPFRTKKSAAEAVINDLPKDEKGTPYDLGTVLGWFRERGFAVSKAPKN